ncbi:hypothetical protein JL721_10143 [Aureococcus anophagefferens]|nr:hypothetical protein JL721_10143 [Aureococcus anophagefferens]
MSPLDPLADSSDAQASSRTTTPLAAEATNTVTPVWSGVDSAADASSLKRPEDFLHRPRTRGPKTRRARWGSVNLIHAVFEDGFPDLEERYVREKAAADRRYEYNLGSRTFDTEEDGDDGLEHLKKLFRTLDRAAGNPATDDDGPPAQVGGAGRLVLLARAAGSRPRAKQAYTLADPDFNKVQEPTPWRDDRRRRAPAPPGA